MKLYAMKLELDPSGIQPFYPVYFNKKKFLKAVSLLHHAHDWKYFLKNEADTDFTEKIIDIFEQNNWSYKKYN